MKEEERLGYVLQSQADGVWGLEAAYHGQRARLLGEQVAAAPRAPAQEP
jgi:hypothetical protein